MINVYFSELPKTLTEILGLKYDETMSYEERVQKRYEYIKEQYELDNKYEGWDYIELVFWEVEFKNLVHKKYLVSTKGRILSLFKGLTGYTVINGSTFSRYKMYTLYTEDDIIRATGHRIVGCTFISLKGKELGVNRFIINHKDLDKRNNHFTNLEWCTQQENVHHALLTREHSKNVYFNKYLKATWIVDDKFKGTAFGIKNLNEIEKYFGDKDVKTNVSSGLRNKKPRYGCVWGLVTREEWLKLPPVIDFIKNKINHDRPYITLNVIPIKGTIMKKGSHQGETFTMYGKKEFKIHGLEASNIRRAIRKYNGVYRGCIWGEISRDEAETLQRGLTTEQMEYLGFNLHEFQ